MHGGQKRNKNILLTVTMGNTVPLTDSLATLNTYKSMDIRIERSAQH